VVRAPAFGKGTLLLRRRWSTVLDSDWEVVNSHYRVFLDGQWLDVPDDAVLTQPNLYGRTVVWPIKMFTGMTIRCFIPGSMM
jgi:hypothetical protein